MNTHFEIFDKTYLLLIPLIVTLTIGNNSLSGQSQITIDGDLLVEGFAQVDELRVKESTYKIKKLTAQLSPWHDHIVLLHPVYDNTNLPNNYAVGKFFASRGGTTASNRKDIAEISTESAFSKTTGWIKSLGAQWQLKTFSYNGINTS